jgi:hypothetical protein
VSLPEPVLEVMADAARVAHAAGGDDDEETAQPVDRLGIFHAFGSMQQPGIERMQQVAAVFQFVGMPHEHFRCAVGERRIDEDARFRNLLLRHQPDEIRHQFLRALHGERGNDQRAAARRRRVDLGGQVQPAAAR